ncbi:MAG: carboxypeptidase M32, partial [Armatimonadota bacterium]
ATRTALEGAEANGEDPASDRGLTLRRVRRDFDQAVKIPTDLVEAMLRETALAHDVWVEARAKSDYAAFAPTFSRILDLLRRQADCLGWKETPYDALLDQYEPGMRTAQVRAVFDDLKPGILGLLGVVRDSQPIDDSPLRRDFDESAQIAFGEMVVRKLGFDFEHGRQDRAVHPFCTGLDRSDVRITTRVERDWLPCALMGTIHEAGHGMYEQGFDPADDGTPLSGAISLGFHESQSRLWENIIGRSRFFWNHFFPGLQRQFPGVLDDTDVHRFYRAINKVEPSFIRVEADEVTYNLHVLLRFEIEVELLEGRLNVNDVPEAWNTRMREYLGIVPPDDARGCLQDVHWSAGLFGYFPTYSIGTILSAQLFEKAERDVPTLHEDLVRGEYASLLGWLRAKVHRPGRRYEPTELVERICGAPFTSKPYIRYLHDKYREIYLAERRSVPRRVDA